MSVLSCLSVVLLFHIICAATVLSEKVPAPENVTVISLNMGLVLEWDPPQSTKNKFFNYTAEMMGWDQKYNPVCLSSSSLSCDFTDNVSVFGTYQLRVRAELHGETSDWVQTEKLSVDEITEISAPHVQLRSRKGQTEVDITDPVIKKKNLRDVFDISYLIRFWKNGETEKKEIRRQQNRVMLPKLEPLVKYCVEVEILYSNNTSQTSNITCLTNTRSNELEPWLITVVLLVSFLVVLVAVVLIFLAVWFGYRGCRIIFPDTDLPEDLKKFLAQRSQSSIPSTMQESKEDFCELRILHKEPKSCLDSQ